MQLPRLILSLALAACPLLAQLPEVQEKRLANGARILRVARPGSRAVHVRLLFRGGFAEFMDVPQEALRQVAWAAFQRMDAAEHGPAQDLEALLERMSGVTDSLRKAEQQTLRSGVVDPLEADLKGLLQNQAGTLQETLPQGPDLLEALGASRRQVRVTADFIETSLELPAASLEAWAELEAARLQTLRLPRQPLAPIGPALGPVGGEWDLLLGAAFPGHPYGRGAGGEACTPQPWLEARALARRALGVDRLVLVLVGELPSEAALGAVEKAFGALPPGPPHEAPGGELPGPAGARRLLATTTAGPRLLVGWRIPPADHPDSLALNLLASTLGEGQASRLRQALVGSGLAQAVRVTFGVPGRRDTRLLAIEARPEPGHNLQELALAIESEILRLQQDPFTEADLRRLQMGATVAQLETLADADTLAQALGEAMIGTGEWRTACTFQQQAIPAAETLQRVARNYLTPARRTEVFLESDPLEANQDLLERQTATALLRLASLKGLDAAQAEELARQTLRQLRMVPREDRQALLNLLVATGAKR